MIDQEEVIEKAQLAKKELKNDPSIIIKVDCYNEDEYKIFKRVFTDILGSEAVEKSVRFTWLSW